MDDIHNKDCAGAWVDGNTVCKHCLTEEDEKVLEGLLSEDELNEAREYTCKRCGEKLGVDR